MLGSWSSAQFIETLPALAVTPAMNERTRTYAQNHSMKIAEVMRQALTFFLDAEDAKGEIIIPISEQPKPKSKKGRVGRKARAS
jgi:hypothetical protein